MSTPRTLSASVLAVAAGALLATAAAGAAAARPDAPPEPVSVQSVSHAKCPLTRVGTQFTRCDDLTGAGVPAPSWIPEQ